MRLWSLHPKYLDADLKHVVRTLMFVTDISHWEEFGRAHHECFAEDPPATTMVEVKQLIDPDMLIEIEADAVCLQIDKQMTSSEE